MQRKQFHVASEQDIKSGKVTDVYFHRTQQVLKSERVDKRVVAEFVVKNLPDSYNWGVFAGLEEVVHLLQDLDVNVWAMEEGTIFGLQQPVLVIEGRYLEFGVYETAILGLICQASGIATKAARCKKAAGERLVLSFGARRIHPALAPMVERNAYIGGCDGVAVIKSAELLGLPPSGTIPHALILLLGDTVKAVKAFDQVIDKSVPRVALIDTFSDEKFEAIRVAEALKGRLFGMRLDTPGSRRGNFLSILKEVRWELDLRGFHDIKLFVSGGLDENKILELNPVVDAYGVGTAISSAPVLDYAMDIVEIEGNPVAKRGKMSGRKQVFRCPNCLTAQVVPTLVTQTKQTFSPQCQCGQDYEPLLKPLVQNRQLLRELPKPAKIRQYVLQQLERLEFE